MHSKDSCHSSTSQSLQLKRSSQGPTTKVHKATWMSSFHQFQMLALTIPGSHNAACYSFPGFSIVTSNAKCQSNSILKQLLIGVRYLDIRIRAVDGNFWVGHSFQSRITLSEVLWQVKCFMDAHPTEVVVFELDFEHHPVGKGSNTIDWKRVAYLIQEVFHAKTWTKVDMDKLVALDVSTQNKLLRKHQASNSERPPPQQIKLETGYAKIVKHAEKYLYERRKDSQVKDESLLDAVYGEDRLRFEIWWQYNCFRTTSFPVRAATTKSSSDSESLNETTPTSPNSIADRTRSITPVDLNTFLEISVPWEDRNKTIGEWLADGKQMVLLNDHFRPTNSWPRSFRIKSWKHTRTPHIGDVKELWHQFTFQYQEAIIDEEQEVWTHLNCVLTLNMKTYFSKVLGRGGFEAYCRACNRALLDLLKWEKEEDKKYHFHEHIRLQIVDCDYVDEEICQLLIERNFRLMLQKDESEVQVEAKSPSVVVAEDPFEEENKRAIDEVVDAITEEHIAEIENEIDDQPDEEEVEELQVAEEQLEEVLRDIEKETET